MLVDGTGALGDPLQGARRHAVRPWPRGARDEAVRRRFLARHQEAEFYADFPDFSFWRLHVEGAHYIGGFGRIVDFAPTDLLVDTGNAQTLLEAEPEILAHMNEDHADAIQLYATALMGARPGAWRIAGIDPEGCDIILDGTGLRIAFASPIASPDQARKELVRLGGGSAGARRNGVTHSIGACLESRARSVLARGGLSPSNPPFRAPRT